MSHCLMLKGKFPTNNISEGQFLAESYVEAILEHVGMYKFVNSRFILLYFYPF